MMNESRIIEISVESARELPNVRHGGRPMKVFTEVSISGRPETKMKTTVDDTRGSNPIWNFPVQFFINDEALLTLLFEIQCVCFAGGIRKIGEIRVPIRELPEESSPQVCQRTVITPSGEEKGGLTFTYLIKQGPPPPPPPENGLPDQPENGHVPGRIRELVSMVSRIVVVVALTTAEVLS